MSRLPKGVKANCVNASILDEAIHNSAALHRQTASKHARLRSTDRIVSAMPAAAPAPACGMLGAPLLTLAAAASATASAVAVARRPAHREEEHGPLARPGACRLCGAATLLLPDGRRPAALTACAAQDACDSGVRAAGSLCDSQAHRTTSARSISLCHGLVSMSGRMRLGGTAWSKRTMTRSLVQPSPAGSVTSEGLRKPFIASMV